MQITLTLLLPIFGITGWFFPKTVSVSTAVLWMWFLYCQIISRASFKTLDGQGLENLGISSDGRTCLLRYAMFFKMPYVSMGISNAASLWLMACFPWAVILWFQREPIFIICPVFVWATCFYLVERLNPLLYLSRQAMSVTRRGMPGSHPFEARFLNFATVCEVFFNPDAHVIGYLNEALTQIYPDSLFARTAQKPGRT